MGNVGINPRASLLLFGHKLAADFTQRAEGDKTMIRFARAAEEDAAELAQIQMRAFHSQNPPGFPKLSGPPGYDSVTWQIEMMKQVPYTKIIEGATIVGGLVLLPKSPTHCHVERIYLDPLCHGRGIGTQTMKWMEKTWPEYKQWTLRTPAFHVGNQRFYEGLGYLRVGEREVMPGFLMVEYEKRIGELA